MTSSAAPGSSLSRSNSSLGPSDSVSQGNTPVETGSTVSSGSKRQRINVSGHFRTTAAPAVDLESQDDFERSLIRVVASADLSFNFVENPEVSTFFKTFMPGYALPSRRKLAGKILSRALKEVREQNYAQVKKQRVTIQCDGWTGRNHQHLVAFMMTTESGKVWYQCSTHRLTADNFII